VSTPQSLIERIQQQLVVSASQNFDAIAVPPFTLYINSDDDSSGNNYAIPNEPTAADLRAPLDDLCAAFRAQGRQPRFEFIDEYAPTLAAALADYGFVEEMRTQLMLCTPATYCPVVASTLLEMASLEADGPIEFVQALMTVQQRAFGIEDAVAVDALNALKFRRRFSTTQFFAAWVCNADDKEMASVASLLPAHEGITEVAGIATAARHRRQGIAAALTSYVVQQAFDQGLGGVFLTAANAAAGRVYERSGFCTVGTGVAYYLPVAG